MNLETLQQRIATGEDLHTEFKEWPIHADSLAAVLEMAPAKSRGRPETARAIQPALGGLQ